MYCVNLRISSDFDYQDNICTFIKLIDTLNFNVSITNTFIKVPFVVYFN